VGDGPPDGPPRRNAGAGRAPVVALTVVVVVLLGVVLLWPDGGVVNRAVVRLYVVLLDRGMPAWVTPDVYAGLLNVVLFVPLGWLGVSLLRWPPVRVVLGLAAFSAAVELVQALPALGRDASVGDLVCNTLGAALGAAGASVVHRRRLDGAAGAGDQPRGDQPVDEGRDVRGDHLDG
jgi:glycopeptide antibiotics resistance protein